MINKLNTPFYFALTNKIRNVFKDSIFVVVDKII